MFIVSECINTFWTPMISAQIISTVTTEGVSQSSIRKLYILLALMILRSVISWAFHGPARLLEETNAFLVRANYRKDLLSGVMNMPLEWQVNHHSGDTIDKVNKGTNALYEFSEESFQVIKSFVKLVGCFAMIMYFSFSAAYIVITIMVISTLITIYFDRIAIPQYRALNLEENRVAESIHDAITNISTVIILRVESLVFKAIMYSIMRPLSLFEKNNKWVEWKWFVTSMCCQLMTTMVLGLFFYQHLGTKPGILAGSTYLLLNYLERLSELFYTFTSMYSSIVRKKFRVINAEEVAKDFVEKSMSDHVLPEGWRTLEIQRLNFSYHSDEGADLHLDDISLSIRRGEKIAFVGTTGSGKTTLLKVMRDLYHPKSLQLFVDGQEIPQGFEGISRAISLMPQNPEIFATTILENITLGAMYEEDFVRRFTDMACFTKVADSLPKGFDSSIKERGVNLSGGQQQRLALSRGLLASHDKDIVLLDEPTSSLDVETEMIVYRNIFGKFGDKTVVSSIHRLQLLPLFDRIYLFRDGRIYGGGTLSELLATSPGFLEFWNQQFVDPS
ncbi:MAG TPA: ABC transporter ATP-binding protein [Candidatus Paceibacterota bacterium]